MEDHIKNEREYVWRWSSDAWSAGYDQMIYVRVICGAIPGCTVGLSSTHGQRQLKLTYIYIYVIIFRKYSPKSQKVIYLLKKDRKL